MKKTLSRGFTLIEIMVVIAIMALLAAIILPRIDVIRARSRDDRRIGDISQIRLAVEHYFTINGKYPATLSDTGLLDTGVGSSPAGVLPEMPTDPSTGQLYNYAGLCPPGNLTGNPTAYHLGATLEQSNQELLNDADVVATTYACAGSSADFGGADTAGCDASAGHCYDFVTQ